MADKMYFNIVTREDKDGEERIEFHISHERNKVRPQECVASTLVKSIPATGNATGAKIVAGWIQDAIWQNWILYSYRNDS